MCENQRVLSESASKYVNNMAGVLQAAVFFKFILLLYIIVLTIHIHLFLIPKMNWDLLS